MTRTALLTLAAKINPEIKGLTMNKNIFIATAEPYSGKSVVALGLLDILLANAGRVGYFKPVINHAPEERRDAHIDTAIHHFNLDVAYEDAYAFTREEANRMAEEGRQDEIIDAVIAKYKGREDAYDFTVIEGSDFLGEGTAFEFDANVTIAKNLAAPAIIVVSGEGKSPAQMAGAAVVTYNNFRQRKVQVIAVVLNKVAPEHLVEAEDLLRKQIGNSAIIAVIPSVQELKNPTLNDVRSHLDAEVMFGEQHLGNRADSFVFGAMQLGNFLNYLKPDTLVITPGDRSDIILGVLQADRSDRYPKVAGILLTGGLCPPDSVIKLIEGLDNSVPLLSVKTASFEAANSVADIRPKISADNTGKIHSAVAAFRKYIDVAALERQIIDFEPVGMTPRMFQYKLTARAKREKKHIVLPEGSDDRVLIAADRLVKQGIIDVTLLGRPAEISASVSRLGLSLCDDNCRIIYPPDAPEYNNYVQTFFELRKGKNTPLEVARDLMTDVAYFGTMMVYKGHADGMVSGAVHTTAHTIRPALQFIKTKPGTSLVSSVFFMCLPDRVTVFGDCAININPTAEELAEIAISSADSAARFGIDPRVAMLSYSSGDSGTGADVDKVRAATGIIKSKRPDIAVEGPIQYDAAVDPLTGSQKLPDSKVAGRAGVLIFPDLNTGNNTYKAVQRETGAVAIGPMLQGLNKPVNDLSRGCTVDDIFNTAIITAIQAQG